MKRLTSVLAVVFVLSLILAIQAMATQREAAAWGLPEGFNPETGQIEKTTDVNNARNLIGTTVENKCGEALGTVEDIVFSDNGRVRYFVLLPAGQCECLVPVPWKEAKLRNNRLVLDVDKAKFQDAPSFARNDWQRLYDPEWDRQVNSYY